MYKGLGVVIINYVDDKIAENPITGFRITFSLMLMK